MGRTEYHLLVIDDDTDLLSVLHENFSAAGWTLRTVGSLADARGEILRREFSVVLSDYHLPDGLGIDFIAELRSSDSHAIPILMTGLPDMHIAVDAINRGKVFQFVTKPLDIPLLIQTVKRALNQQEARKERERITRDMSDYNERLRRDGESNQRHLQLAAVRLRAKDETVAQQESRIALLNSTIQTAYLQTVSSLTAAMEARDRYTKGHSDRVYYFAAIIADVLGLPETVRNDLRIACVLHDLGKIGIPDSILSKPGPLTSAEREIVNTHPDLTDRILSPLPFLQNIRKIVHEHHERFDGSGYPLGLKGEQITLEGRILALADAYDAMRSDRAYRCALTQDEAEREVIEGAGKQFCPLCAGALLYGLRTKRDESPCELIRQELVQGNLEERTLLHNN